MLSELAPEPFDPDFAGQLLETTYFDTPDFSLRKARARKDKYLTLRIRRYSACGLASDRTPVYALSGKTESSKFRVELSTVQATAALQDSASSQSLLHTVLSADFLARLFELAGDTLLAPVVKVCATRYAVESETDRLTLDLSVATDTGKALLAGVLEHKTSTQPASNIDWPRELSLRPIKLSKFLWATQI
jgi:hypothetical protein